MCCLTLILCDTDSDSFMVHRKFEEQFIRCANRFGFWFCQLGISYAKWRRTLKMRQLWQERRFWAMDENYINTYFPLHCKLVLAQISIFKSYVNPQEPGDTRKDDQSIFKYKVWPSLSVSVPWRMRKGKGLFMRHCITKSVRLQSVKRCAELLKKY